MKAKRVSRKYDKMYKKKHRLESQKGMQKILYIMKVYTKIKKKMSP